ncbi:MAG TPA: lytic transglycosylase domain-containing protein [Blastocatellia bacterium]|nr:lytic transglycosylase domain-containing protein [Blastocatellia bacterium]
MKLSAGLIIIASLGLFAVDARAQEARLGAEVELSATPQLPRTPTLVVINEVIKTPQDSKPATTLAPKSEGATSKTAAAKPGAPSPAPAQPLKPIVMQSVTDNLLPAESVMSTTGNPKYDELIKQSAARNGIDPNLMVAVMRQESGFNPRALSYKGATGLMQLMPGTARRFGVTNIYDPADNIEGGAKYLRFLLDTFNGDVALVLAGYNAGENAVINSGYQIPRYRETQNYVKSISARYDAAKNRSARKAPPAAVAVAPPSAATFSGGRLSNNY